MKVSLCALHNSKFESRARSFLLPLQGRILATCVGKCARFYLGSDSSFEFLCFLVSASYMMPRPPSPSRLFLSSVLVASKIRFDPSGNEIPPSWMKLFT
jgi:hypothetical protein